MRHTQSYRDQSDNSRTLLAVGLGLGAVAIGYVVVKSMNQKRVVSRPIDDAPVRTTKAKPMGNAAMVGRTITINRPRAELFAFWADFANLPQFMQSLSSLSVDGDIARWKIAAPMGRFVDMETRMTANIENEVLSWASTENSEMKAEGKVTFRDAPAGRGTELEAELSYVPPLGEVGRLIGKLFQTDPLIQGRRELRRFKMLMEAGEIATGKNHKAQE